MYHMDADVEKAMVALADALCIWERNTGRESTLILVPHLPDEQLVMLENGKPMPCTSTTDIITALAEAQTNRPGGPEMQLILLETAANLLQVEVKLKTIGL